MNASADEAVTDDQPTSTLFFWVFLMNAVVAAVVYYVAVRTRLPKDRVDAHIHETENESGDAEAGTEPRPLGWTGSSADVR